MEETIGVASMVSYLIQVDLGTVKVNGAVKVVYIGVWEDLC